ncbi:MAG: hypothetical protein NTX57_12960 [Armatimonadetes bacterium]|nr:hypothetical protein [Armatimonadota bacterium]
MTKRPTVRERVVFGLDTIPEDRTVMVSLRELLFVQQTLAELNQFFHQPMHYPDLAAVNEFMGTRRSGGAYEVINEALYTKLGSMLPEDLYEAFDEGTFEHPDPPAYFVERGEQ